VAHRWEVSTSPASSKLNNQPHIERLNVTTAFRKDEESESL
jgi:hypothetical protein